MFHLNRVSAIAVWTLVQASALSWAAESISPLIPWIDSLKNEKELRLVYEFQLKSGETFGPIVFITEGESNIIWRKTGKDHWIANAFYQKKYYFMEGKPSSSAQIYNAASKVKAWIPDSVAPRFVRSESNVIDNPILKPIEFCLLGLNDQEGKPAITTVRMLRWNDMWISTFGKTYLPFVNDIKVDQFSIAGTNIVGKPFAQIPKSQISPVKDEAAMVEVPFATFSIKSIQCNDKNLAVVVDSKIELPWFNADDPFAHGSHNVFFYYTFEYKVFKGTLIPSKIILKDYNKAELGSYVLVATSLKDVKGIMPINDVPLPEILNALLEETKVKYDVLSGMAIDE